MKATLYKTKPCRCCGKAFAPRYANDQVHPECWEIWRREYHKLYQQRQRQAERTSYLEPERL
jgi:hypothetical protein